MTRGVLLSVAVAFAALGLLTVVRSPDWLDWRVAVIAGQFGYAIAIFPIAVGLFAWFLPGGRSAPVAAVCALAAVLLVQPCAQAWLIGRGLPGVFERQFGPAGSAVPPFSVPGLFRSRSTWSLARARAIS
jgi:hypothetical protein